MKPAIPKRLLPLAFPAGLIILGCLLFLNLGKISPSTQVIFKYSSYAFFLLSLVLSYWFNRSRIFFVVLYLVLAQFTLTELTPPGLDRGMYLHSVYTATSLLIPVNLLAFSMAGERGILTAGGKTRLGFILAQLLFTTWAAFSVNPGIIKLLNSRMVISGAPEMTPLPQLSVLTFIAAILLFMVRFYITQQPMEGSFAAVAAATFLALHFRDNSMAVPLFFTLAGLLLAAAVVQDSYRKAYLDDLTGLPGRRALNEELVKLDGKYSIAMLDIDFFKKFNDTYGHDVGDEALRFISSFIKDVSGGGRPFRYGGEEFTILFPGKGIDDVLPHLEELRGRISRRRFTLRGKDRPRKKPEQALPAKSTPKRIQITVSIGVSEREGRLDTADDVIKSADTALYRAKKQGRNCVCC